MANGVTCKENEVKEAFLFFLWVLREVSGNKTKPVNWNECMMLEGFSYLDVIPVEKDKQKQSIWSSVILLLDSTDEWKVWSKIVSRQSDK